MQPRRTNSKKWTAFPPEFSSQIESVFRENFANELKESKLLIEGRIYPEEILLRVGVLEKGRLKQSNFEVSIDYKTDDPEALDRINHLVDVAASMMTDYFENEDVDFPRVWKEFPFKGKPIYLQYTTDNTELEAQADALLGINTDSMVQEQEETEDALDIAEKDKLH
jgi:hypothetical protein